MVKHGWFPKLAKNQSGMKVLKRTQECLEQAGIILPQLILAP
jgi:hypothetical protein